MREIGCCQFGAYINLWEFADFPQREDHLIKNVHHMCKLMNKSCSNYCTMRSAVTCPYPGRHFWFWSQNVISCLPRNATECTKNNMDATFGVKTSFLACQEMPRNVQRII